jgi:hypothetical protein
MEACSIYINVEINGSSPLDANCAERDGSQQYKVIGRFVLYRGQSFQ